MLKQRPFNIFPSVGYKNSQFQILTKVPTLIIELFHQETLEKTISLSSEEAVLITKLDNVGTYIARCSYQGEIFEQKIEVKDAFRLGSSEFKKAFVFDNSEYSFFLMKDRLLLYNESEENFLTENHYSPTKISQIDKSLFLFITELGSKSKGVVNLGIYSTDSFTILGELLNEYQAIQILPEMNKAWLYRKSTKSIHYFELANELGEVFIEIIKYENASNYGYNSENQRIYIEQDDKIIFIDSKDPNWAVEIAKTSNNAIDEDGNNLLWDDEEIQLINKFEGYSIGIDFPDNLNLTSSEYLHIGANLQTYEQFSDLAPLNNELKNELTLSIPKHKTTHYHFFPEEEIQREVIIEHCIFPTLRGAYFIFKEREREFKAVKLKKKDEEWSATPQAYEREFFTIIFSDEESIQTIIKSRESFKTIEYCQQCLIVLSDDKKHVYSGKDENSFSNECSFTFHTIDNNSYLLVEKKDLYSLYSTSDIQRPLLDEVEIYNIDFIELHKTIWYANKDESSKRMNHLRVFDLSKKSKKHLGGIKRPFISFFKNDFDFKFEEQYFLNSNKIIVNPKTTVIKGAVLGTIESYSNNLDKIVSRREDCFYLSIYDSENNSYENKEIKLNTENYQESYLSPNGKFLVLKDGSNKHLWYDIEKDETVTFISGNFLAFSKEGNLIIESDNKRAVKIYDPVTFFEITPLNYHYYRFLSPDGKLYAQLASEQRFINRINGSELTKSEVSKIRREFDDSNNLNNINRRAYFLANKEKLKKLGLNHFSEISSEKIIKTEKYTEIGIVGTEITCEVHFPEDLDYYNYAAFSFDNKYFGYVGKPNYNGLIHLFKIDFDEKNKKLSILDSFLNTTPRKATWTCGFSKNGYFATYDSIPDTYLFKMSEELFQTQTDSVKTKRNINQYRTRLPMIKGKNFLCFSPSGRFVALSEEGYNPRTANGYGHQESGAVHIAMTVSNDIIKSYTEHGDKIKDSNSSKVAFVSFSEDERKIMTLSSDGVVLIRNLDIKDCQE